MISYVQTYITSNCHKMGDFKIRCCVCLNAVENVSEFSNDLIDKLQAVVPEVEWSHDYKICETCLNQLDVAYEFRIQCLQLDSQRKTLLLPQIYNCYHCGDGFTDKEILTDHILTSHQLTVEPKPRPFGCDTCDKTYATIKVLRAHQKKCKSGDTSWKKTFTCEVCDLALIHAKQIVEHCVKEHGMDRKSVKPYTCNECSMRFSSSANLIQHKKYHKGSRSHICSFCGKSYITKSDLTVHEYTHFNRRNYKCEFCVKAFNTNKNLRSHLLVVHTDPSLWKYGCDVCNRRFPLKSGFDQHMKRHTGDKKFVCHICNKSFVSRSELQKHMSFHSVVKPFKCGHCDKAYKDKRLYDIHLTKSHGIGNAKIPVKEKKYACHICPSTFFDKQKLERHLRIHSGLKPYVCLQCDKKFSDKSYLRQHLKNVHNVDPEHLELKIKSEVM